MIVNVVLRIGCDRSLRELVSDVQALEGAGATTVVLECASEAQVAEAAAQPSLFEGTTVAGYLARRTTSIGLAPSDSALYGFPYHVARRLATLDHLSAGRAGWAVRTWTAESERAGFDWRSPGDRVVELRRAAEFAEVALALWDSWDAGAVRPDKATGQFKDDSRIRRIEYRTDDFLVRGPLDVPRSPQGRPMMFARLAETIEAPFAARFADVVVPSSSDPARLAELVRTMALEAADIGRADQIRITPMVSAAPGAGAPIGSAADAVDLVGRLAVDGVTLAFEGSAQLRALCSGLIPQLADAPAPAAESAPLVERLGLERVAAHGRRVA